MKRIFDLFLGLALLAFTLPIWLLAVAIILWRDPGPIFFKQLRVGLNEKEFYIFKFRTMFAKKVAYSSTTLKKDPRVFRGGYFLRKYKIDEVPQILNVILGSMSLVGPRPTVSDDVSKMTDMQKRRFSVRPGITGLAQISGNTSISWQERIEFDLDYINRKSFWRDVVILVKTVFLVIRGRADTHPSGDSEWD